jgi:uncharacterized protein YjbI with pentapeptide repeats
MGSRGWSRIWARFRWLIFGIAALVGFLVITYIVLKWTPDRFAEIKGLDAKERIDARQGVRTASLALLAGTIGVVGAVYTARGFALNRAGQLTDRFSKAIEQLGHKDQLDVRLGGIYALERIARDSNHDHPQVVEVLTAYIREHAPRRHALRQNDHVDDGSCDVSPPSPYKPVGMVSARPDTDLQAALTVLGRRTLAHEQQKDLPAIDLSWTSLAGADLAGAHLTGANLERANLAGAILRRVNLQRANLAGANLAGANLVEANLGGANLAGANLAGANLGKANLSVAHLGGASLERANLAGANLERSNLAGAILGRAKLTDAHLEGAILGRAHLAGAHLAGAQLDGAQLGGASLERATLDAASLVGANLAKANLDEASFGGTRYDQKTIWPQGFRPEVRGDGAVGDWERGARVRHRLPWRDVRVRALGFDDRAVAEPAKSMTTNMMQVSSTAVTKETGQTGRSARCHVVSARLRAPSARESGRLRVLPSPRAQWAILVQAAR